VPRAIIDLVQPVQHQTGGRYAAAVWQIRRRPAGIG
jgi:hypothetical protein